MFRRTQDTFRERSFDYGVVTLYDGPFQVALPRSFVTPYRMSYNPKRQASWFCMFVSLATQEIAFAFSSSRYLDVSVPWVCLPYPMYSDKDTIPLRMVGFPIRKSSDQSLLTAPRSISALVRPSSTLVSRHPPCALSNLTKLKIKNMSYTVI